MIATLNSILTNTVSLTVFYALYMLALRLATPAGCEEALSMYLVFGYLGLFNIGIATPVLFLLLAVGLVSLNGMSGLVFIALVFKVRILRIDNQHYSG